MQYKRRSFALSQSGTDTSCILNRQLNGKIIALSSARVLSFERDRAPTELELELIQPHMAQEPVLRGEVGCACVAREVSAERGNPLISGYTPVIDRPPGGSPI